MNKPILGCIADDLTGATDLCNNLVHGGMRVILTIDVPANDASMSADAIVVALKSRNIPPTEAVSQSVHALTLVAQPRSPSGLLQDLFHVRFDPQRQHRSSDRSANGRTGLRLQRSNSGIS